MSEKFKTKTLIDKIFVVGKVVKDVAFIIGIYYAGTNFIQGNVQEYFESQKEIRENIAQLTANQLRLLGETKIIREVQGLTYVEEPVCIGDEVLFHIVVERTTYGAQHRLVSILPHYTDRQNTQFTGTRIEPVRQVSTERVPLTVPIALARGMTPGRHALFLELEYELNGVREFDQTSRVAFILYDERDEVCD